MQDKIFTITIVICVVGGGFLIVLGVINYHQIIFTRQVLAEITYIAILGLLVGGLRGASMFAIKGAAESSPGFQSEQNRFGNKLVYIMFILLAAFLIVGWLLKPIVGWWFW
jgi:hypothetical protein